MCPPEGTVGRCTEHCGSPEEGMAFCDLPCHRDAQRRLKWRQAWEVGNGAELTERGLQDAEGPESGGEGIRTGDPRQRGLSSQTPGKRAGRGETVEDPAVLRPSQVLPRKNYVYEMKRVGRFAHPCPRVGCIWPNCQGSMTASRLLISASQAQTGGSSPWS